MRSLYFSTCLLITTCVLAASDTFAKGAVKLNGATPTLEVLTGNIRLDYDMSVSFNPPRSDDFLRGYKVADKLFSIGLITFIHRDGEKHPFSKLNKVKSIRIIAKESKSLDAEISGFNLYMWSKSLVELKLVDSPSE